MVDLVNHCEFSNSFLKKLKIVPEQLGTQWYFAYTFKNLHANAWRTEMSKI